MPKMRTVFRVFGLFAAVLLLVAFFLFCSTHNDYYQGVRALESYNYAKGVTASTASYYAKHSSYPDRIEALGLEEPDSSYVGHIDFDRETGVLKIRLAGTSMEEGVLLFRPRDARDGPQVYECQPVDVPTEFLPGECAATGVESNAAPQTYGR